MMDRPPAVTAGGRLGAIPGRDEEQKGEGDMGSWGYMAVRTLAAKYSGQAGLSDGWHSGEGISFACEPPGFDPHHPKGSPEDHQE